MRIPERVIADIANRTNIVELIGNKIKLKKNGANFIALCPFHQEKTPSFVVSPAKQIFNCFGCGQKGDSIAFLMAYENLSFMQAVETLATRLGISLEKNKTKPDNRGFRLKKCMQAAAQFYARAFREPAAQGAIKYLQGRGITGGIAKKYQLGFAVNTWDGLQKYLLSLGFSKKEMLTCGLLIDKKAKCFDRFRGRIIFPIRDKYGDVLGFGSRVLQNGVVPKYLNSPESELFHKSYCLYGEYEIETTAKIATIFVVEGYMDVLALAEKGFKAVATLGTAITEQQVAKLLQWYQDITFCFDGDAAGQKAAAKALALLVPNMHAKYTIKFLTLPEGEDPDSLIRARGAEYFLGLQHRAFTFADYYVAEITRNQDLDSLETKAKVLQQALDDVKKIPDTIFGKVLLHQLEKELGINIDALTPQQKSSTIKSSKSKRLTNLAIKSPIDLALALLLRKPELVNEIRDFPLEEKLSTIPKLALFAKVATLFRLDINISDEELRLKLPVERARHFNADILRQAASHIPDSGIKAEFTGAIARIRQEILRLDLKELLKKAKAEGLSLEEKEQLQGLMREIKLA